MTVPSRPNVSAGLVAAEAPGRVDLAMSNFSSRRVTFWVTGVVPEVGITLDGNTDYSATMQATGREAAIRLHGPDGEVLASLPLED